MSMQGLKEYKEIFIFTLTLLTQNIVNIDLFYSFYTCISISMRRLQVYKQNIYFHIDTFNTNITTNQCKHWLFKIFLHHNSINIQGLKVYK